MTGTITWEPTKPKGDKNLVDSVPLFGAADNGEHFEVKCRYEKLKNGAPCIYTIKIPKFGGLKKLQWSYKDVGKNQAGKIANVRRTKTCNGYVVAGTWKEDEMEWFMTIVLNY